MNIEEFEQLVRNTRSVRRFDEDAPVGRDMLVKLVDLARLSSCGGNNQPLRYYVASTSAICKKIFPHIAWAGALKNWDGPEPGERPTGYIAITSATNNGVNCGIAAQTIQFAAVAHGFATCLLGAIERDNIREILEVPEELNLNLLVAVGKPAEKIVVEDVSQDEPLAYYRTADNVHHVPKLRLEDVLMN